MFPNRSEAGERLLRRLPPVDPAAAVVLALPRGGVPVAAPIARGLGAPLDLVLVRKVGAPRQPELAVGAVTDGGAMRVTINEAVASLLGLDEEAVRALARRELPELERRRARYLGGRAPLPLEGRTAILVDDGVATGATARAALRLVRQQAPARVILAVPVAPPDALDALAGEADAVVWLEAPDPFVAVGAHYRDFAQVSDDEVAAILRAAREAPPGRPIAGRPGA